MLLEAGFEHFVESDGAPGVTQSIFNFSGLYQRIVAAPRNPIARYTAVVEIDPETDPTTIDLTNICAQRSMLAGLLPEIAAASPSVIVVDKYFLPKECGQSNQKLWGAVRDISWDIPVIIGRRVVSDKTPAGDTKQHYLMPSLPFPIDKYSDLREGIVNIDPDTRKLPLKWNVYANKREAEKAQHREWYETLALTAARAYDSSLLIHHPSLDRFVTNAKHPYISFMKKEGFFKVSAAEILSDSTREKDKGKSRTSGDTLRTQFKKLKGKVVFVGELNRDLDDHPSVVGSLPGLYMQANYVEALLDDRYYRPMPVLDYVVGLGFMIALELILLVYHDSWWKLAVMIALLFLSVVGLLYLMVMHLGWYVNPALVGGVAVLIKTLHTTFGPAERAAHAQDKGGKV